MTSSPSLTPAQAALLASWEASAQMPMYLGRITDAGYVYTATTWNITPKDFGTDQILNSPDAPLGLAFALIRHDRAQAALDLLRTVAKNNLRYRSGAPRYSGADLAVIGRVADRLERKLARPRTKYPMPGLSWLGRQDATTVRAVDNVGHQWIVRYADHEVRLTHADRPGLALSRPVDTTDERAVTDQARQLVGVLQEAAPTSRHTQVLLERAEQMSAGRSTR